MKKRITLGLFGVAFLVLLGALFVLPNKTEHSMKKPEKTIMVGKSDSGKEISANFGDIIQIELEGAGSTGYWWYVDALNEEYLHLISEDTKVNQNQNKAGAPVTGIWKFKALKTGKTTIKLDYFRSWEGKESAVDHFEVNFSIN